MAQGPAEAPTAGPSTPRILKISGSTPGMLDPTQTGRLCRSSGSKLSFASFDPRAATAQDVPDMRKLSLNEELYRPKRVVVETIPTGENFWRFVPSAHKDGDITDEGQWPRVVEICGQLVECSQDQWDIYKLDPLYHCNVRTYPNLTVIAQVTTEKTVHSVSQAGPKRRVYSQSPEGPMPPPNPRKKVHKPVFETSSSEESEDDEVEVQEMVIDDGFHLPRPRSTGPSEKAKKWKEKVQKSRKERRDKTARRAERLERQDEKIPFILPSDTLDLSQSVPPEPAAKRKVNSLFDSLKSQGDADPTRSTEDEHLRNASNYVHTKHSKRTRTVSPSSARRDLEVKRLERERQKHERREKEMEARRQERDVRFLNELYTDAPEVNGTSEQNGEATQEAKVSADHQEAAHSGKTDEDDEETVRQAAIAESRRKLAELEADRPLWEREARNRMAREQAEEESRRQKAEERKRAVAHEEAERKARAVQEEIVQREEALRREKEEMSRRERERSQRQKRWTYGPWTPQRALDRYKALSEIFDTTRFSEQTPLRVDDVPWPVLQSPATFSVEDVDWASVEGFFETVKLHMRAQDYMTFVEKSHRRFHPDRWRSRSLLKSVVDETQRSCMEVGPY